MTERMESAAGTYPGLPEGRWLDVGGIRTWYAENGQGPTVVCIHGGHAGSPYCSTSAAWGGIFAANDGTRRLVAVDRIGQGYTDNPQPIEAYTLHLSVRHVIGFIESLGGGPVHLVGHSRGGYVAARAALERQDLVRSLTLLNSGTLSPGVGTNEPTMGKAPGPITEERVAWMYGQYSFGGPGPFAAEIEATVSGTTSEKYQELLRAFGERSLIQSQVFPDLARGKRETLTWLTEGRLQRPTHIIWGRNDRTAHPERGLALYELIRAHERRTTLSIVERSGHFPQVEHPEWTSRMLFGFIDEVEHAAF